MKDADKGVGPSSTEAQRANPKTRKKDMVVETAAFKIQDVADVTEYGRGS